MPYTAIVFENQMYDSSMVMSIEQVIGRRINMNNGTGTSTRIELFQYNYSIVEQTDGCHTIAYTAPTIMCCIMYHVLKIVTFIQQMIKMMNENVLYLFQ